MIESSSLFCVEVSTRHAADAPKDAWDKWRSELDKYDLVLSSFNGGDGLVVYHSANNSFSNWPACNQMPGLGWRSPKFSPSLIVGPEHDFQVTVLTADHPIIKGLPNKWMYPHEQLMHGQHGPAKNMTVLSHARSKDTGENEAMDWVIPFGKGRVYVTMPGHLCKDKPNKAMRCIGFQTVLIRGCEWAATGEVTYPVLEEFPTAMEMRACAEATVKKQPEVPYRWWTRGDQVYAAWEKA